MFDVEQVDDEGIRVLGCYPPVDERGWEAVRLMILRTELAISLGVVTSRDMLCEYEYLIYEEGRSVKIVYWLRFIDGSGIAIFRCTKVPLLEEHIRYEINSTDVAYRYLRWRVLHEL